MPVMQNWSVANSESVGGGAANKSFSYCPSLPWSLRLFSTANRPSMEISYGRASQGA
jgi:hypothetical protein